MAALPGLCYVEGAVTGREHVSELTFWTNPMSRGRIARWMLEETGAEYESVIVQYGPEMTGPDYRAINPMAKVPAIRHHDTVVTECAAICAYLADAFPAAGLAPSTDSPERGAYYRWLFFAAGPIEAAVTDASMDVRPDTPELQARVGYGSLDRVLDTLDGVLADREWLAGERFSAADVYLGSQLMFGTMFGTIAPRGSFTSYIARLQARPAYMRATEIDGAMPGG